MAQWRIHRTYLAIFLLFSHISSPTIATHDPPHQYDASNNKPAHISFDPGSDYYSTSANNSSALATNASCDRPCFLEQYLGPRTYNLTFTVLMGSLYSLILLTGIFGNISTCLVILFNSCMHTTTNY